MLQEVESSGQIDYLEKPHQKYEKTEKRGPLICNEKLNKETQDLIWDSYRTDIFDQVVEKTDAPDNIEGLKVNKVNIEVCRKIFRNIEVCRKISRNVKHNDLQY